jgi:PIN domain nuclease of toxin-antitoxin system
VRLLLDTHAFLWWVANNDELSRKARAAIADTANECFLSVASAWEMAIKLSLGKLELPEPLARFVPAQLVANGFVQLPIEFRHTAKVATLTFHHRDPFDRLLIAQAIEEKMHIVSADTMFKRYGVKRVW